MRTAVRPGITKAKRSEVVLLLALGTTLSITRISLSSFPEKRHFSRMETSLPLFPDPLQKPLLLGELHLEKDAIDIAPPYTLGAGRDVGGAKAVELPEVE